MSRRRPEGPPGVVLVDKPAGPTSFDVVRAVRRATGRRRVGHGGTLDPFATGLLVVGLGSATRLLDHVARGGKTYRATLVLGRETDTGDATGETIVEDPVRPGLDEFRAVAAEFLGEIDQVPPRHSAIKIDGRRAYARARAGEDFEMPSRRVRIDALEILDVSDDDVEFEVTCSGGTYVRTLGQDLARAVGAVGHLSALRRTRSGALEVADAVRLDTLEECHAAGDLVRPAADLVRGWPRLPLDDEQVRRVRQGTQPDPAWWNGVFDAVPERVALLDAAGELVAVARRDDAGDLRLATVLPTESVA